MHSLLRRAHARHSITVLLLAAASAAAAAADVDPVALELPEAQDLAVAAQPLLEAQRQAALGARAAAVAAGELPDPTLVGGVTDLTITGPDRFSLRDEADTQLLLGVKQMFPGGGKRALRRARGDAEAGRLDAEVGEQRRMVRREAALTWLEVWQATQAQALVKASVVEAQRQVQAADIAYRSSRASQAELLGARVSHELLEDALANLRQQEQHARNQLRRWIGDAAERLLCPDLPAWPAPDEPRLLAHLETHPHVTAQSGAVQVARADVELAQADYAPDWSLQAGYGYRPQFADYASLQFEVGLPVFTRNRQDRAAESRRAELARAESLKEDWLRQHRAEIRLNVGDWVRLRERVRRYDEAILPQAVLRLEAAVAGYGAGNGTLSAVLEARRGMLDVRVQRLQLEVDSARHQVELEYFVGVPSPYPLPQGEGENGAGGGS